MNNNLKQLPHSLLRVFRSRVVKATTVIRPLLS